MDELGSSQVPFLGVQDVLDALQKAVIDRGADYVYTKPADAGTTYDGESFCVYFDQAGEPSCIVGHVLSQVGVAPFPHGRTLNRSRTGALFAAGVIDGEMGAQMILADVQENQDSGRPWGQAVERTERSFRAYQEGRSSHDS